MAKVKNPHDVYVRRAFRKVTLAADFFCHYLPPEIVQLLDLERVTHDEGAFADKRLRQQFSDLLFRVGLRAGGETFVQLLVEHKSAPEKRVGVQIFRYLAHILARAEQNAPLPPVIPVVLYHGRQRWDVPTEFAALFELPTELNLLRPYLPHFNYYLCDLSAYNELPGGGELQTKLSLLKNIFSADFLTQFPAVLQQLMNSVPMTEVNAELETAVWYAQHGAGANEKQTSKALQEAFAEIGEDKMPTIIDKWREEGLSQGIQQGLEQGLQQTALLQLNKKLGRLNKSWEAKVEALKAGELTQLSLALLDFETTEDLANWLKRYAGR